MIPLGYIFEIPDKPIQKILNSQLDIQLKQFKEEEFEEILKKIKNKKIYCPQQNISWSTGDKEIW